MMQATSRACQVLSMIEQFVDLSGWRGRVEPRLKCLPQKEVAEWFEAVKTLAATIQSHDLTDLAPDWDNEGNVRLFFKHAAQYLAMFPGLSAAIRSELNAFSNAPPLIFRRSQHIFRYDFLSSRIPQLQSDLAQFKARANL